MLGPTSGARACSSASAAAGMSITPLQTRASVGRGGEHGGDSSSASATAALRAGDPAGELPRETDESGRGDDPLTNSASNVASRSSPASPLAG